MINKLAILFLFALISQPTHAKNQKVNSQLFLVGGGLKSCSSMSKKNCNTSTLNKFSTLKNIKHGNQYQISQKTINLLKSAWPKHLDLTTKERLIALIENTLPMSDQENISLKKLKSLFYKSDKNNIIAKLTDPEYYTLLDLLEQPVVNEKTGKRLKEHVELLQSSNHFSTTIYQEFVSQAKINSEKDKPTIIVLTASARDPFEAADFYQAAFEQAGANAKWLPLDATLNNLMQQIGNREDICKQLTQTRLTIQGSMNREYIYPDLTEQQLQACLSPQKLIQQISDADGVFINGGDQSLTLKAFIKSNGSDTKILTIIKEKLRNENFIIGGTSAGTAVMSGGLFKGVNNPMITNGQSNTAIVRGAKKDQLPIEGCQKSNNCDSDLLNDDLTYRSNGGLGLFRWGVLDTHFSERGRQGRLAQLALDTNATFAFGVDEATALIVKNLAGDEPTFSVIGQGGVFIIENDNKKSLENKILSHYINYGDTAYIAKNKLHINIAQWKNIPAEEVSPLNKIEQIFDDSRYKNSTEVLCKSNLNNFSATDEWKNYKLTIVTSKRSNAESGYGAIKVNDNVKGYCAYKNYNFAFNLEK